MHNTYTFVFYNIPMGMINDIAILLEPFSNSILATRISDINDYTYFPLNLSKQLEILYCNAQYDVELLDCVCGSKLADYIYDLVEERKKTRRELENNLEVKLND